MSTPIRLMGLYEEQLVSVFPGFKIRIIVGSLKVGGNILLFNDSLNIFKSGVNNCFWKVL